MSAEELSPWEKQAAAELLVAAAADLVDKYATTPEEIGEYRQSMLSGVSPEQLARQYALWLHKLPMRRWDRRLPEVWKEKDGMDS